MLERHARDNNAKKTGLFKNLVFTFDRLRSFGDGRGIGAGLRFEVFSRDRILSHEFPECSPVLTSRGRGLGDVSTEGSQIRFDLGALEVFDYLLLSSRKRPALKRLRRSPGQDMPGCKNPFAVPQDHGTLHHVFELAHVAWPVMTQQNLHRFTTESPRLAIHLSPKALEKVPDQFGDVLKTLARGRDAETQEIQPVVQIIGESRPGQPRLPGRCWSPP